MWSPHAMQILALPLRNKESTLAALQGITELWQLSGETWPARGGCAGAVCPARDPHLLHATTYRRVVFGSQERQNRAEQKILEDHDVKSIKISQKVCSVLFRQAKLGKTTRTTQQIEYPAHRSCHHICGPNLYPVLEFPHTRRRSNSQVKQFEQNRID